MQQAEPKSVRRVYDAQNDDAIWRMFSRYACVTVLQAQEILGCKFDYIQTRLRRLSEGEFLGRVQLNEFMDFLYYLRKPGAEKAVSRGAMKHLWYIQRKSAGQIPHEKGLTNTQMAFYRAFPGMESRRFRSDLQRDFLGEVMDMLLDLHDGVGWAPVEYIRTNYPTREKLHDYDTQFPRAYFVLPTQDAVLNFLENIEEEFLTAKLWFTSEDLLCSNPKGKIWWTPAQCMCPDEENDHQPECQNFRARAYSILPPTSHT